jgi:hypothetical protein
MRISATIATGVICFASSSAFGQMRVEYPYCAYGGKAFEGVSCDFATLAQCQAATSAGNGSCIANPRTTQTPSPRQGMTGRQ